MKFLVFASIALVASVVSAGKVPSCGKCDPSTLTAPTLSGGNGGGILLAPQVDLAIVRKGECQVAVYNCATGGVGRPVTLIGQDYTEFAKSFTHLYRTATCNNGKWYAVDTANTLLEVSQLVCSYEPSP